MKKQYERPCLELYCLEMNDIILTSGEGKDVIQLDWDDFTF